jgi:glycosyltransferase involved in cell wall biosynthesis
MKISVLIPVYNNECTIIELYERLISVFNNTNFKYEIIFVDDCGSDKSAEIISNICIHNKNVILVKLLRNFGQRFALMAGLKYASGDYILNLDADLQDPPELIKLIFNKIIKKSNLIVGVRAEICETLIRRLTSSIQHKVLNFLNKDYPINGYTVFCISKILAEKIKKKGNNISVLQLEILKYGYSCEKFFYKRKKRIKGSSEFTFFSRLILGAEMIAQTKFSMAKLFLYLNFFIFLTFVTYISKIFYNQFHTLYFFYEYLLFAVITLILFFLYLFFFIIIARNIIITFDEIKPRDKFKVKKITNKF